MKKVLFMILAVSASLGIKAQEIYSLKQCIETGLERNYSIRIVRNEQLISDNNATPGNAGYLPTVDRSGGFSGSINNNRNKFANCVGANNNLIIRQSDNFKNQKTSLYRKSYKTILYCYFK